MRIRPQFLAVLLTLSAIAAGTACSNKPNSRLDPSEAMTIEHGDDTSRVTVRIENQGFADVDMYVVPTTGGIRTRLGTANGHSTTVFDVPKSLIFGITELRFVARPIGGGEGSLSDRITVQPGDEVTLTIPPS